MFDAASRRAMRSSSRVRGSIFAVALALAASQVFAQQVYKWVDEKGVTHYGERPPDEKKASKVDTKSPTGDTVKEAPQSWKDRALDAKRQGGEKDEADDYARKKQQYDENRRKDACAVAKRELAVMETKAPVFTFTEKGERTYIEDKDRPAAIAKARRDVDTYCK